MAPQHHTAPQGTLAPNSIPRGAGPDRTPSLLREPRPRLLPGTRVWSYLPRGAARSSASPAGREPRLSQQPKLLPLPAGQPGGDVADSDLFFLTRLRPEEDQRPDHGRRSTGSGPGEGPAGKPNGVLGGEEAHCNTRVVSSNSQIKQTASAAIFTSRSATGNR